MSTSRLRERSSFNRTALAGFVAAISVLALGMCVGIRSMSRDARAQEAHLRAKEQNGFLAEKLRWRGDLLMSAHRAFQLSHDPRLAPAVRQAGANYDAAVQAFASGVRLGTQPNDTSMVATDVQRDASNLARVNARVMADVEHNRDPSEISRTVHDELLPDHRELEAQLDRFVNQTEAAFAATYDQVEHHRRRSTLWVYALLGILVLAASAIALHFTKQLSRAYGKEAKALEAARQASAARDELMAVVAHDLRNPLGAITMKASVMREGSESEKTRKQAHAIENVSLRMDYLIKTMLDVVTIEAGHFVIKPAVGDAAEIVSEVVDMFGTAAEAKQIQLSWQVTPRHLDVRADRQRVIQVLTTLVGNALTFTPQGGRVTISVDAQGERALFAIADTGPGFASEELPRVFDRFWRTGPVSQKGMGLGLFIAKSIVLAHGGAIWVTCEPGGTTFSFTLALAVPERSEVEGPERAPLPSPA